MEELRDKGPVHVQSREIKGLLNKDDTHVWELSRFSHVLLCVTLWTVARQVPLCLGFSRQEYWSGLPCPPPGDLSHPGIKPVPLISPALAGWFLVTSRSSLQTRELRVRSIDQHLSVLDTGPDTGLAPWLHT